MSISNDFTFPFFAFLSAGLVNFFVPSGGGSGVIISLGMLFL
ncbi:Short chain fatty acid transporter [Mycobacteroides abscessus subsp. abscessus]|nr:Short chain fatty acid transporter [Mycobacteroides abscessus subsp. abscessus]